MLYSSVNNRDIHGHCSPKSPRFHFTCTHRCPFIVWRVFLTCCIKLPIRFAQQVNFPVKSMAVAKITMQHTVMFKLTWKAYEALKGEWWKKKPRRFFSVSYSGCIAWIFPDFKWTFRIQLGWRICGEIPIVLLGFFRKVRPNNGWFSPRIWKGNRGMPICIIIWRKKNLKISSDPWCIWNSLWTLI